MKDNNYTQLCVWQGVELNNLNTQEFENWMLENFDTRIKYETQIKTLPDLDKNGCSIPYTGVEMMCFSMLTQKILESLQFHAYKQE